MLLCRVVGSLWAFPSSLALPWRRAQKESPVKYVLTVAGALVLVAIVVRVLKQVKPDWGGKLASLIVGA